MSGNQRQLEFSLHSPQYGDRNSHLGGRSFYFFDFDDNVAFLPTPIFVFHSETGEERALSTHQFAVVQKELGQDGEWKNWRLDLNDATGSFRRFRQLPLRWYEQLLLGKKQPLEEDLLTVLKNEKHDWRGPSWQFFWHAVHNQRPLSLITARGHSPETLKSGIKILVNSGHLSKHPNYLSVFPVSFAPVRHALGDTDKKWHTSQLKQSAIRASVEAAFQQYGLNPHHRFGMSDDDPTNVELIIQVMRELKAKYPGNSFFVINTFGQKLVKQEIFLDHVTTENISSQSQLNLF